ncbi:MAG: hypothetical protein JJ992_10875, partial [Planctomycetes bacterium]|nr:hypothetical protein [Planctomycetota bacterium]
MFRTQRLESGPSGPLFFFGGPKTPHDAMLRENPRARRQLKPGPRIRRCYHGPTSLGEKMAMKNNELKTIGGNMRLMG